MQKANINEGKQDHDAGTFGTGIFSTGTGTLSIITDTGAFGTSIGISTGTSTNNGTSTDWY